MPPGKSPLSGQQEMIPVRYEGTKSKKPLTLFYTFWYDEEQLQAYHIPPGFYAYEYFVANTLDNLFEAGDTEVSPSKILREMGETGSPGQAHIEKLVKTLIKGATTTMRVNDLEIQKAWGKKTYREIVSQVFPIDIENERFIAGGNIAQSKITIKGVSPFRKIARNTDHLTSWKKEILQLYSGRKTDRYWAVLQFLLREIGWMRNAKSKRSRKIDYSTLYARTGATKPKAKTQTRDMMYKILEQCFKGAGYITAYKEVDDAEPGVILTLATDAAAKKLPPSR